MKRSLLLASSAAVFLIGCSAEKPAPTIAEAPKVAALGSFGVETTHMDAAVKPGDDFFKYANGKWLATFQMPADKARFGSFDALGEKSETDVKTVVEELAAGSPAAGTTAAKVGDIYASWMDEAGIEARELAPLQPYLDRINAVTDSAGVLKLMSTPDFSAPFGIGIEADPDDPTQYSVWAVQAGIGMPDRDYYLKDGASFEKYRAGYKTYVTKVFELLGDAAPAASADQVIALETKIARGHWAQQDLRNVEKAFNTMTFAEFKAFAPSVQWDGVLAGMGLPATVDKIVAYGDTAVRDGAKLVGSEPVGAWKKYLAFHIASDNAANLPKAFDDASFDFYGKTLRGVETKRDRWKRGVTLLDNNIGEGVGEVYVAKYFPPENKAKMDALVANLRSALDGRLKTLAWMDDPTRAEALKKLGTFEPRIGYPSKWRDYSAMTIEKGKHFENMDAARKFEWNRQVARLNEPVDRSEWGMNAQTVNAQYNPLMNQITFPAAILQPPFFDANADPAVNYGAIGGVIGHEIGHGFDDQGRAFDESGRTRNWWTPETDAKFKAATDTLAAQYDAYCPVTDGCINGRLTMGENIGDLGGLTMAYTAYKLSLNGQEAPVIDGFTGDQRFFLAWAQVWRATAREDDTRQRLVTDPHSMPEFRTNGVVRNMDEWYAAFNVQPGDKLYIPPEDRVRIW
ncbi:MAG: M13 family metallopeptidase [Alphaproteobacteria bacterium]|nr:M13 family metallopeptidase [Alphaproteobacteria bacterium]